MSASLGMARRLTAELQASERPLAVVRAPVQTFVVAVG